MISSDSKPFPGPPESQGTAGWHGREGRDPLAPDFELIQADEDVGAKTLTNVHLKNWGTSTPSDHILRMAKEREEMDKEALLYNLAMAALMKQAYELPSFADFSKGLVDKVGPSSEPVKPGRFSDPNMAPNALAGFRREKAFKTFPGWAQEKGVHQSPYSDPARGYDPATPSSPGWEAYRARSSGPEGFRRFQNFKSEANQAQSQVQNELPHWMKDIPLHGSPPRQF